MWRVASGHCHAASKLPRGFLLYASQQRRSTMETSPDPWIDSPRSSRARVRALGGPLALDQLEKPSYAGEWSIAQVLSHLGSQAEIFGLFLEAGLTGHDPPGMEQVRPIWALLGH